MLLRGGREASVFEDLLAVGGQDQVDPFLTQILLGRGAHEGDRVLVDGLVGPLDLDGVDGVTLGEGVGLVDDAGVGLAGARSRGR